jgi:hypothetical protein
MQTTMKQGTARQIPAHRMEFGLFPRGSFRRAEKFWRYVGDGDEDPKIDPLDSRTYGGEAGIRILKRGSSK